MQDDFGNAINPNTARTITARLDEGDARMTRIEADLRANTEATERYVSTRLKWWSFRCRAGRFQGPELDRQGGKAHHIHRDDGQCWLGFLEGADHWRRWPMNETLRNRLLATAAGLAVTAAGGYVATQEVGPSPL